MDDDKLIDGLTQEEWCEYIELLSEALNESSNNSEEKNELPQC